MNNSHKISIYPSLFSLFNEMFLNYRQQLKVLPAEERGRKIRRYIVFFVGNLCGWIFFGILTFTLTEALFFFNIFKVKYFLRTKKEKKSTGNGN